ncbi:hypothetical protein BY458DRAFT_514714, partial [Sporodiniella umbellata]
MDGQHRIKRLLITFHLHNLYRKNCRGFMPHLTRYFNSCRSLQGVVYKVYVMV